MNDFKIVPQIYEYSSANDFCNNFNFSSNDLIFISKSTEKYFSGKFNNAHVIYRNNYGSGEPTDLMVEKIYEDIKSVNYKRVIAIGGGTIIDVAKLLALKEYHPVTDLFEKKIKAIKDKELIIIPTTCGTGSEVTNISILELTSRSTKMGLADDSLYADYAILIPELLSDLPYNFFATSSIDALIHATESFLSPKATSLSRLFSIRAIQMILRGYMVIAEKGPQERFKIMKDFLLASLYAGLAFANAGTGYVHAMSYSFGATYHVPHGEANAVLFSTIFKEYNNINPSGLIHDLNRIIAQKIHCKENKVYEKLDILLNKIIKIKSLKEYGVTIDDLTRFTENTVTKQERLTSNGYIQFSKEQIHKIYESVYSSSHST